MDASLQKLIDKSDVSDTVKRYFMALDRFDWDLAASCVADTFQLEADAPGVAPQAVTREQFMESLIARNGGFTATMHINPDHLVTVDGDSAHVSAHMWAAHGVGAGPGDWFWGYGLYEIDLQREVDGRWRLTRQRIDIVGIAGPAAPGDVFGRAAERQANGEGHY